MNCKQSLNVWLVLAVIAVLVAFGQLNLVARARAQAETPTPEPPPGATRVREADGAVMVYVPAGEFLMGSLEEDGEPDEHPQHNVMLDAYWIDRTEVTNGQFEQFVTATGYRTDAEQLGTGGVWAGFYPVPQTAAGADWRHPEGPDSDITGRMNHPVVQVSWNDARAYCEWAGARLPTEAEWEKAARGTDAREYPWGNERATCQRAVMFDAGGEGCGRGKMAWPVGSKPEGASPYGALDMAGNVWEWVADWFGSGYYAQSPASNPPGPDRGTVKASRGGAWTDAEYEWVLRSAFRGFGKPTEKDNATGFRCAVPAADAVAPIPADTWLSALSPVSLTIVYDNVPSDDRLETAWGYACLVETNETKLLFDTGGGDILLRNMDKLGIDPRTIDQVVLSHSHSDHTGGFDFLLDSNEHLTVYVPQSFLPAFKSQVAERATVVGVTGPAVITEQIRTTGELGEGLVEQALIVETDKGLIVVTGCAHPGIVEIVRAARQLGEVYLVMGGFHEPPTEAIEMLKDLGVQKVAPSHCTGDWAIYQFQAEFGDGFMPAGAGFVYRSVMDR